MTTAATEVALPALTPEQTAEGYSLVSANGYVQVWHRKSQIALLLPTGDLAAKVNDVVERRRQTLREVEAKTGWKAS